jgi:ubiquinone/menaquinone biosynthesis C-methylase UbiE
VSETDDLEGRIGAERLQQIYDATAAFYDGVVAAQQAPAKLLALDLLARRPGERFLEAGCGTAWALSRVLAATGAAGAVGIDFAPGMIDVARHRLAEAGIGAPPLLLADARRLPFHDASFVCLLSTYTLEVLPAGDIAAVLSECRRVLAPGGRIVVVGLTPGEGAGAAMTDAWSRGYAADPEYFGGARPLRCVPLLEAAGFRVVTRRYLGPEWPSEVVLAGGA